MTRRALHGAVAGLRFPGLLASSGWVLLGTGVSGGATLLASVLLARLIAPVDFGKLTVALTAVTLLAGLAGLGLTLAITRRVAEVKATRPAVAGRYIGSVIVLTAVAGLAIASVMALARHPIAQALLRDGGYSSLIAVASVAVFATALNSAVQAALTGLEAFRHFAVAGWLQGLGTALGLIVGAGAGGATDAMTGFAIGQCAAAGCSLWLLRRNGAAQGVVLAYTVRRDEVSQLFRFGIPAFVAYITGSCAVLGGQLLLSRAPSGYAAVALFSVAYRWHVAIQFIPGRIVPVLIPALTRLHVAERNRQLATIFRATMWVTTALTGIIGLVVVVLAPLLLALSGGFYSRHPLPLILLAAASVPAAINSVLSGTSVSVGAMREWLISDVVLAAVLLGTAAALVDTLGATGLAIAYLVGMVATDLALAWPLARRMRVKPSFAPL
jgi:PST family polysaccharide transporter